MQLEYGNDIGYHGQGNVKTCAIMKSSCHYKTYLCMQYSIRTPHTTKHILYMPLVYRPNVTIELL